MNVRPPVFDNCKFVEMCMSEVLMRADRLSTLDAHWAYAPWQNVVGTPADLMHCLFSGSPCDLTSVASSVMILIQPDSSFVD